MDCINRAGSGVCEDGDKNMFFDVEWSRIEGELQLGAGEEDTARKS